MKHGAGVDTTLDQVDKIAGCQWSCVSIQLDLHLPLAGEQRHGGATLQARSAGGTTPQIGIGVLGGASRQGKGRQQKKPAQQQLRHPRAKG